MREHEVGEVVVGLPRRLDGTLGPQAEKVQAFAADLRGREIPVASGTSASPRWRPTRRLIEGGVRRRDRKHSVDKVAAVLILQGFLDYRRLAARVGGGLA